MRPQLSISALSFLLLFMSHSSAGLVEIANVEELRRLSEDHICYVVGYFENLDSAEAGLYRAAVADEFNFKDDFAQTVCRGIPVAISSDDGVRKVLGIKGEQGIVMISEGARSLFSFRNMDFPIKRWIEVLPKKTLVTYIVWNFSKSSFQTFQTECDHSIKSEQNIKTKCAISVHLFTYFYFICEIQTSPVPLVSEFNINL
ncbi:hypothetical protein PMAYCL1PPCAC_05157, partial [Pristionchus mayeri]